MPAGATNRSKTAYVLEVTSGTTPASPAMKEMRVTSNALTYSPTRTTSAEIRSDRQVTDQILTKLGSGGSIGIELSFSALDDMIQAAFQGTWVTAPSIAVVTSDVEISDLSTTTATVASALGTPFKVGMLVASYGFTLAANNNIISRVSSSTATTIVFPASSFTAETLPIPVGATLKVCGLQGASADLVATVTNGNAITSTALDFTTLGLTVGQWVNVGGDSAAFQFATAANNGWCRISAVTATRLSFDIVPTSWAADTGTGKTVQVFYGDFLSTGTTQRSFTIERQQQDITTPAYEYFTGCQVDQLSLAIKSNAIVSGSLGFMGMGGSLTTTRVAGATDVTPSAYPVMNASSNVGRLFENGVAVGSPSYFRELSFDLKNNLREQEAIGNIAPIGVGNGEIDITGNLTAYFGDIALLNKTINNNDTALMFRIGRTDNIRESIIIDVPAIKVTLTSPVSAKNQDRAVTGTYAAKRHATLGYTASAARYFYLPIAS